MHFSDLKVYCISKELEQKVIPIINGISYSWNIPQVSQIRRSSSSVTANIIEGCSHQKYPKNYIRFLTIALGSCDETQHHLFILNQKKCINDNVYEKLVKKYKNLAVRINNFITIIKNNHNLP